MDCKTYSSILIGDCLSVMKNLPDGFVQTCVTSPPYWGLRDYGTATWEGGDPECKHQGKPWATKSKINENCGTGKDVKNATHFEPMGMVCTVCGARRIEDKQLGLEPTVEEYVANMVDVFREVRRVLKDDGTLWLNLGDSYAAARGGTHQPAETLAGGVGGYSGEDRVNRGRKYGYNPTRDASAIGLKHKDLIGVPWRVAFALQADGWYLRQDIIWHKPNPMPESVRDRCTKSHEYIFLLSKRPKYYFDSDSIRTEPKTTPKAGKKEYSDALRDTSEQWYQRKDSKLFDGKKTGDRPRITNPKGANKRDVWTVASKPFKEAHFATFPPDLIRPCVLAGAPKGGVVLDPFSGAGTVGLVCAQEGRGFLGIELNEEYVEMAARRIDSETK